MEQVSAPHHAASALSTLLPSAPLGEAVLSSCGAVYSWGDVREWMISDGSWAACARRAAEGRALALGGLGGPSGDALRQAAQRFRRERKLIAGEDLARWLGRWGLSEEEWVDFIDRTLRREAQPPPSRPDSDVDEQAAWVEALCSGELLAAARRLARALGAWGERGGGTPVPAADRWTVLREAYGDFVAQLPDREELDRVISANAVPWLQIAFESVSFPSGDAAREALASVRDDGVTLVSVAQLADADFDDSTERAEDVEPRLRSVVMSSPLDVPVLAGTPDDPGLVVVVRGRRHPTTGDPGDEELAAATVVEQRVQSAMDRWVTWRV
jgi:hypothetical protein